MLIAPGRDPGETAEKRIFNPRGVELFSYADVHVHANPISHCFCDEGPAAGVAVRKTAGIVQVHMGCRPQQELPSVSNRWGRGSCPHFDQLASEHVVSGFSESDQGEHVHVDQKPAGVSGVRGLAGRIWRIHALCSGKGRDSEVYQKSGGASSRTHVQGGICGVVKAGRRRVRGEVFRMRVETQTFNPVGVESPPTCVPRVAPGAIHIRLLWRRAAGVDACALWGRASNVHALWGLVI